MMKNHIKIFIATLLLLGACKTQKPVVQNSVSQAPVTVIQPKADTVTYNYPPPRNYSVPKKVFKELENYETAFDELKAMLEGTKEPIFERAVFISENPYQGNKYTYEEFQKTIDVHIDFIKQIIANNDKSDSIDFNVKVNQYGRFNLDDIRHLPQEKKELYQKALSNWAIFKYITSSTAIYPRFHLPYTYASNDPFGKKDWANSQVIKLLISEEQKGNCFSLTAFYKILADRLKANARLCTAPQHIYIQHRDIKGDYYNTELATAGHPGDGTIQTLTHTTTEAIKSGISLRSFDAKQSIGLCLVNLAKSYEHKYGSKDDDFLLKCAELVLKHDPLNLNALLLKQQILDVRVTNFALENNISDINKLKANNEISETVNDLENHLALLYRLGYRQMPYDMQEIIMTGIFPKDFKDKNPSPFTTIDPKDEHRKSFKTLYGGLFQEVFELREFEPYGHFTFQTTTNKITVIDTTAQTGFLIDPVAFAYDFGARMYDARLGIFTSVDPQTAKLPNWSPYAAFANNPIIFVDPGGEYPIYFITRSYAPFKTFGLPSDQFYGDNRGHTLDKGASYRTMVSILHDTELKTTAAYGGHSRSHNVAGTKDAISKTTADNRTKKGSSSIDVHSYGNNAAQGGSWDIDQFTKVNANIEGNIKKDHILHLTGTISGDNFPNQESMIYDAKGNTLWLGNFESPEGSAKGPLYSLGRENESDVHIKIDVSIKVNKDGVFQGVMQGDKMISISDWNKKFKSDDKKK